MLYNDDVNKLYNIPLNK